MQALTLFGKNQTACTQRPHTCIPEAHPRLESVALVLANGLLEDMLDNEEALAEQLDALPYLVSLSAYLILCSCVSLCNVWLYPDALWQHCLLSRLPLGVERVWGALMDILSGVVWRVVESHHTFQAGTTTCETTSTTCPTLLQRHNNFAWPTIPSWSLAILSCAPYCRAPYPW